MVLWIGCCLFPALLISESDPTLPNRAASLHFAQMHSRKRGYPKVISCLLAHPHDCCPLRISFIRKNRGDFIASHNRLQSVGNFLGSKGLFSSEGGNFVVPPYNDLPIALLFTNRRRRNRQRKNNRRLFFIAARECLRSGMVLWFYRHVKGFPRYT